jgi:muramoyltetrapeptide carboxypeptidase
MKINFLQKNDIVDIVTIGTATNFNELILVKNFLKKINLKPRFIDEKNLLLKEKTNHEFASFSAKTRFSQLKKAIEKEDSKIIWCLRGGYGTSDLLPFLNQIKKPKEPKIFIGFSDITSINNFLLDEMDFHLISAPMLAQIVLRKVNRNSSKSIVDFIFGLKKQLKYSLKLLNEKNIKFSSIKKTKIVGGCLSVIASAFGTKNQIDWQNKILFLEDEGESGERLDRYFQQIIQIILEQKKIPKAILLGNFVESNIHGLVKEKNILIAIEKFSERIVKNNLKIPLFMEKSKSLSKSLGHSKNMMPLLLGFETEINNDYFLIQKFE